MSETTEEQALAQAIAEALHSRGYLKTESRRTIHRDIAEAASIIEQVLSAHTPAPALEAVPLVDTSEMLAAGRLVEAMKSNEHYCLTARNQYLNHSLGTWRVWRFGEASRQFDTLDAALTALTGSAGEGK